MRRAVAMARQGDWPEAEAIGSVMLDYDSRYRRRMVLDCNDIGQVLLDLPETVMLTDGDGLQLTDGNWLAVSSAPEDLLEVQLSDPHQLLRVAWHLGNHHCPTDIKADRIRIRSDHVIEAMLKSQGCKPVPVEAAFNPEKGSYHHHPTTTDHDEN